MAHLYEVGIRHKENMRSPMNKLCIASFTSSGYNISIFGHFGPKCVARLWRGSRRFPEKGFGLFTGVNGDELSVEALWLF